VRPLRLGTLHQILSGGATPPDPTTSIPVTRSAVFLIQLRIGLPAILVSIDGITVRHSESPKLVAPIRR